MMMQARKLSSCRTALAGRRRRRGFTLLEALVTLVVFSLGLLGLLGLQTRALKFNQSSLSRSLASQFSYAIADEMRSNPTAARGNLYLVSKLTPATGIAGGSGIPQRSLQRWARQLESALPGSSVQICRSAKIDSDTCTHDTGDYFAVRVVWRQSEEKGLITPNADDDSVKIVFPLFEPPKS